MSTKKGQFKLGAFLLNTGHHVAAWRHPDTWPGNGLNYSTLSTQLTLCN
jgi:hypothetical protein